MVNLSLSAGVCASVVCVRVFAIHPRLRVVSAFFSAPIAFGSIINPGGQERQMKCQTSYQLEGRYSPVLSASPPAPPPAKK